MLVSSCLLVKANMNVLKGSDTRIDGIGITINEAKALDGLFGSKNVSNTWVITDRWTDGSRYRLMLSTAGA